MTDRTIPADLLIEELARLGKTQSSLARELGVDPANISNWKVRGIPPRELPVVCAAINMTVDEYLQRVGKSPTKKLLDGRFNVTNGGVQLRGTIPLVSWTTAGRWADVEDPHQPGQADEWVRTTAAVSANAFALRVVGDSMEPKIPDGSIVIIDPARQYLHGSIVLAKRTGDQQATLKQLWYDGETPYLRPLNPRYQVLSMPEDTRIIGVAVKVELDL